jgi:hypothetical protein
MRVVALTGLAIWLWCPPAATQIELDRTLQRVYGTAIMSSDVRQARLLRLVPGAADDTAVLTAIENRLLMMREVTRGQVAEPAAVDVASRRAAWTATLPAGTDLAALLVRTGMTDAGLDGWFRDDLLLEAYQTQRFGPADDPRRAARLAEWLGDLRHRAGLGGRSPRQSLSRGTEVPRLRLPIAPSQRYRIASNSSYSSTCCFASVGHANVCSTIARLAAPMSISRWRAGPTAFSIAVASPSASPGSTSQPLTSS